MEIPNTNVYLVTQTNPQNQLFLDYLSQRLGYPIRAVTPSDIEAVFNDQQRTLVMLDADHIGESESQQWQHKAIEIDSLYLAAFNLQDEDQAARTLSSYHFDGVFYRNDPLDLIVKGIEKLLDGHLWLSRGLMTRLIHFYRRQQLNAYRPVCGLTQRELDIIGLLSFGSSNAEIAEKLFVSEHTVKTHLYNIFRKIKVSNRIQAMNWAHRNIGIPPVIA
ncbi:response regulator transcription factor [Litchfieldella xinjiangensis]|uniref:response regulator transcription factor n=1 Tax=Litchfieldella xinjiangensis TaxID=1166948 RepID=UPI0005B7FC82|nr:response regulator transcription factor [Halomonas xinjiangensis]